MIMNANQILQSDFLEILFENRNHSYGAYELRANYPYRIKKALLIAFTLVGSLLLLSMIRQPAKDQTPLIQKGPEVFLHYIDQPPPPVPPPPPQRPASPPARTVPNMTLKIVPDHLDPPPVPTVEEIRGSLNGPVLTDGPDANTTVAGPTVQPGPALMPIQAQPEPPAIADVVDVQAKFAGDWVKFLTRNLNGNVPLDHGAQPGKYTVMMEFVVDIDGSISQIRPMTTLGFGMEEEAIRVLKKAAKWIPAMQHGVPVKAYRRQPITFQLTEEQ